MTAEKSTQRELHADEVALPLRYATAKLNKVNRDSNRDDGGEYVPPF